MNVAELARQLRIRPKDMMDVLPQYGFDIGAKAVKIDDRVAEQIIRRWRFIKKDLDEQVECYVMDKVKPLQVSGADVYSDCNRNYDTIDRLTPGARNFGI